MVSDFKSCKKNNPLLFRLKLHKNISPEEIRTSLAKSLVIPYVLYCEFIYLNCDVVSRNLLQVTLNNTVRYVCGLRKFDHISAEFNNFFGCSLKQFFYFRAILLMYKIINSREPSYLYTKLNFGSIRNNNILLPISRSNTYSNSPLICIFKIWNKIPTEIRCVKPYFKLKK